MRGRVAGHTHVVASFELQVPARGRCGYASSETLTSNFSTPACIVLGRPNTGIATHNNAGYLARFSLNWTSSFAGYARKMYTCHRQRNPMTRKKYQLQYGQIIPAHLRTASTFITVGPETVFRYPVGLRNVLHGVREYRSTFPYPVLAG